MKKKIKALSFTPKYDELEDRIRISINYDDFNNRVDLMMSRSFMLKLFPIVDDYMLKFYNSELGVDDSIKDNPKEKMKQDSATSITDGSNLELFKQEDELLIEVKFSFIKETQMSIVVFETKNTQAVSTLDARSMKQIFSIIKSTTPFFSWGISHNL
ncbi:MAG: hypothetical protein ACI9TV_000923 [Sulfurimonas sp.]|uniref:hypothetical protein n=1 Tax=Sulfurimonas sp. TaxID=2022749 RepID=UPI0039E28485